jgi:hypothetical protein
MRRVGASDEESGRGEAARIGEKLRWDEWVLYGSLCALGPFCTTPCHIASIASFMVTATITAPSFVRPHTPTHSHASAISATHTRP